MPDPRRNPAAKAGGAGALTVLLALLLGGIILPFLIWGEAFEATLSPESTRSWLGGFGSWGWLVGVGLIVADIVLPIPGTVVMSVLGYLYGWAAGGLAAAAGSFLAGLAAYFLCFLLGRPVAARITGEDSLRRAEELFARHGGWLVALSRWMPVLPEAVACLAGLSRMPLRRFTIALACGALPLGFVFAAIGAMGHQSPGMALAFSAVVPVLLWLAAGRFLARRSARPPG